MFIVFHALQHILKGERIFAHQDETKQYELQKIKCGPFIYSRKILLDINQ